MIPCYAGTLFLINEPSQDYETRDLDYAKRSIICGWYYKLELMNTKKFLNLIHQLHYLQYPFLILGLSYSFKKYFVENSNKWEDLNLCFLFMGIALSFGGLADVNRIDGITKKVLSNMKGGKTYILYLIICFFICLGLGIYAFFQNEENALKELSVGMIVFSIGIISLIKMSLEIIENYSPE